MDVGAQTSEKTFEFRGQAGEWFGIWIVNLLLSIVTIGIYSAWAKVRRNKYFYNNSYLDGRNFDYHATGKQILIGRLIFIGGYIVFALLAQLSPILGLILVLALLVGTPWLLIRGMKFNARVTSFSNVRFDFNGTYGKALVVFFLLPIGLYLLLAAIIGVGIFLAQSMGGATMIPFALIAVALFPVGFAIVDRAVKGFSINNHLLGTAAFGLNIKLKPFLIAQALALAWVLVVGLVGGLLVGFDFMRFVAAMESLEYGSATGSDFGIIAMFYVMIFAAFIPAGFIYQALVRNAVYNHSTLDGGHGFRSDVNPVQYFWIALSNLFVVVLTLGLMLPWAQIRMTQYLAQHTHAQLGSSLDDFVGGQPGAGGALGDAFSDFEAIDVGLPV